MSVRVGMHSKLAKQRARKLASTVSTTAKRERCRRDSTNDPCCSWLRWRASPCCCEPRGQQERSGHERPRLPSATRLAQGTALLVRQLRLRLRDRVINAGVISELVSLNLKHFWKHRGHTWLPCGASVIGSGILETAIRLQLVSATVR